MTDYNELTGRILGAAVEVHRHLGPGLLESVYRDALSDELGCRMLSFARETRLPVVYTGKRLASHYRVDFVVEDAVVVEVKSVTALQPIFTAQVLTYLKLGGWPLGLLVNFNVRCLGEGAIRGLVHGYDGPMPGSRSPT